MTLEAWVRPIALGTTGRTVLMQGAPGYYAYALYANTDGDRPVGQRRSRAADHELRRAGRAPARRLDAPRRDLRRHDARALRQRRAGRHAAPSPGAIVASTGALRIGGNAIWGEYFAGLIDEVRVYNRALTAAEIQTDMDRSVTPDTTRADRDRADARRRAPPASTSAARADGDLQRGDGASTLDATHVRAHEHAAAPPCRPPSPTTPPRARRRSPREAALLYGDDVQRDRRGRRRRRATSPATRSRPTSRWSFTTEASPPQILVVGSTAEPVRQLPRRDPAQRGPERVHDGRRRVPSARRCSAASTSCVLGDTPLTASQVTTLTNWVNARRQPDRAAPGQEARGPARAHRRRHDARQRVPARRHHRGRRARASSPPPSSTTAPRTATR